MAVFDRVVVGVDGTEWGFAALAQALALAPPESPVRAVTALDVRPAIHTGFAAASFADLLREEASAAQATAHELLAGRPDSTSVLVQGQPVPVLRAARDVGATLLALGARHSSRLLGVMLGDTTTTLLHDAVCSVLLARPAADGTWRPRTVVVGIDGSNPALAALATADELAGRLDSSVEVVSATGEAAARGDGAWKNRVDSWDAADPVSALVERSRRADLLVVGSRGLHGVRALGSVSERVAHRARCSVLVVHSAPASGVAG
jgi:nucleotide-binding universal stress UspA family protein